MKGKAPAALILIMFGFCVYWNVRQGREWLQEETTPLSIWLDEIDAKLPRDARLLIDAPANHLKSDHFRLNTRLHPRAVYALPPGIRGAEEAGAWIAMKRIDWIIGFGGDYFESGRAYVRRAR